MAGDPTFVRAKRLKFFHTSAQILGDGSIELAPTTSLILHPTTNLVASPEGNMIFRTAASFDTDVSIMGNLYVLGSMIVTATTYITDDLEVTQKAVIGSVIHGKATASIDGAVKIGGLASIDNRLAVTGKIQTASTVWGKATASIDGDLNVSGNASVDGSLALTGKVWTASTLWGKATASIDGDLNVSGNASVDGSLAMTGKIWTASTLWGKTTASIDGDLNVSGNASIDGSLALTGKVWSASTIWGKATASLDGNLKLKGNASFDGTLDVGGTTHMKSNASIEGDIKAGSGGNVVVRRKTTIDYHDFTAASTEQVVKVLDIVAGDKVIDMIAKLATPFKYGSTGTLVRAGLGDMSDRDGFGVPVLCGSSIATDSILFSQQGGIPKGVYFWNTASNLRKSKVYTVAASLELYMLASSFYVASLTQGAIHVYTDYIQLPD